MANTLERRLLALPGTPVRLTKRKRSRREDDEDKPEDKAAVQSDSDMGEEAEGEEEHDDEDGQADAEQSEDDNDDAEESSDSPTIEGYAAVFHNDADPGTEYELWSDPSMRAVERVARGAFSRAIQDGDDVRGLFNHDPSLLLGRTSAGTMQIEEDERGLRYRIDMPDTQTGRDVSELIDRGDVSGSSFGFVVEQESWMESDDQDGRRTAVRTIESVRLLDAGPVTYPAYAGTSAGRADGSTVRAVGSVDEARASYQRWKERTMPLEARLAAARARAAEVASSV